MASSSVLNKSVVIFTVRRRILFWLPSAMLCHQVNLYFAALLRIRFRSEPRLLLDPDIKVWILLYFVLYNCTDLNIKEVHNNFKKLEEFYKNGFKNVWICSTLLF